MTDKKNPKWVPQLLAWYDVHKRELPWRDCGDPYKIWVSEVMSQQTRIEAMKPYYDNWMRLFPTLEDLAKASEDEVVHAWQGLGYYSRARNLRLGVKDVVENYGGIVPHDRKTMESLKGVGSYTAGAVLSMAYNEPEEMCIRDRSLVKVARSIVRQSLLYDSRNSLFTFSAQNIIKDAIQPSIDAQYIAIYSHLWFVVRHG